MHEIEVKAHLRDKEATMEKLAALGCAFSEPKTQEDVVYVEKAGSIDIFMSNPVFLRIRVVNGSSVIFTAKKRLQALAAIEHEVEVSDRAQMEEILKLLGYREAVRIAKTRITTAHEGREICIDEVEGLGSFIEMEQLAPEADIDAVQEELFAFLRGLGVTDADRTHKGYDLQILEKALGYAVV
jgi:adenylate cyclase class 2